VIQYPAKKYKIAYPISTYSYAILNQSGSLDSVAVNQGFLNWVISTTGGQKLGGNLDFVPLPAAIRNQDSSLISSL
jgi:ABC-type phosphate transport system substrate-binding protein